MQSLGIDHFTEDPVFHTPLVDVLKGREFGFINRNNHFSANFVGDSLFGAELFDTSFALAAVFRFQGTRSVINPRMEHSRVVSCLMLGQFFFFFEQGEAQVGMETTEFVGGGKAEDSPTDDDHIRLFHEKNNSALAGEGESISDGKQAEIDPIVLMEFLIEFTDGNRIFLLIVRVGNLPAPKHIVHQD